MEDVTSVQLPTIEHPTVDIDVPGMAGVVSMPNGVKVNAMEFTVNHNNGENTSRLADDGKHTMEFRLVRQRYNVAKGEIEHESVKYRITAVYKSTEDGTVETGNPLGSSEKFSVLRYEKIFNGKTTVLIDMMTGDIVKNGVSPTDVVQSMLN